MSKLSYLLLFAICCYFVFYVFVNMNGVKEGDLAPDFKTVLIDEIPFQLSDLRGEYVLLDFWASWCGPCRMANPQLSALHKKYSDKLTIVTVALEKRGDAWKRAAKKDGFTWKHQIVEKHKLVMLSDIARKYGVSEIPAKFLISPKGELMKGLSFDEIDRIIAKQMVQ